MAGHIIAIVILFFYTLAVYHVGKMVGIHLCMKQFRQLRTALEALQHKSNNN